jgi:hypothetical protein
MNNAKASQFLFDAAVHESDGRKAPKQMLTPFWPQASSQGRHFIGLPRNARGINHPV